MEEITAEYLTDEQLEVNLLNPHRISEGLSRKYIWDSWQRCMGAGLDRSQAPRLVDASSQELRELRDRDSFLLHLVRSELPKLQKQLSGDACLLGFANRDAVLIEVACPSPAVRSASRAFPGTCWQEKFRGTNAIGTAAFTRRPVAVCLQEHFLHEYAALNCIAAPVQEPNGELLGTIHLSSNSPLRQRHSMMLLCMAAAYIESEMFKERHRSAVVMQFHNRNEFAGTLYAGLIALNEDGQVISSNRQAQCLLEGMPVQPGCHFDEIFQMGFRKFMSQPARAIESSHLIDIKGSSLDVRVYLPAKHARSWSASHEAEGQAGTSPEFVCTDPAVASAVSMARRAVALSIPILIRGETGTGKEMMARSIHQMSGRNGPFVAVNCAAVPESLIESELFGYREGAFTGARKGGADGLILQANHGTLFLDEIGDMPLNLQPTLLRFLDSWTVRPIGSKKEVKVDVQLVTATNCDLEQAVTEKRFRRDLLYRINLVEIPLPPLRDRSDFDEIVASLLAELSPKLRITKSALQLLRQQPFYGNVRELRNILLRAALTCDGPDCSTAVIQSLLNKAPSHAGESSRPESPLIDVRRNMILEAYRKNDGNISRVAQNLRVSRNTVYRELRQSGVIDAGDKSRALNRTIQ